MIDFNYLVQGSCQKLVFNDRNLIFFSDAPDFQCNQVGSLGNDAWRAALVARISQRDGLVGWVDNHQSCLLYGGDHPLTGTISR